MWRFDHDNNVIAVGWDLGDLADISREEFTRRFNQKFPGQREYQLRYFWYEIQKGDRVIAKAGTKEFLGIGTVTDQPFYDLAKGKERASLADTDCYTYFLPVQWDELPDHVGSL